MLGSVAAYALVAALSQAGTVHDHIRAAAIAESHAAPITTSSTIPEAVEAPLPIAVQADVAAVAIARRSAPLEQQSSRRSPALVGLYASFVGLEALDIHSTLRAIGNGGAEANPAMRGVVSNSASFIAVKAATGAAVIWMSEKMRKEHPGLAIAMMVGLNSAMATVVAHNYSIR